MQTSNPEPISHAIDDMLDKINNEIIDGIKHGFFKYEIRGEILQATGKRSVILDAGKSHKFHIKTEDLKGR